MREDELVAMGFVRGAFGIRGWVKSTRIPNLPMGCLITQHGG